MDSNAGSIHLTIDEIDRNRDGQRIATLVDNDGRILTVPVELLPEGAAVNHVVIAQFQLDANSSQARADRVRSLQHRLFSRDSE